MQVYGSDIPFTKYRSLNEQYDFMDRSRLIILSIVGYEQTSFESENNYCTQISVCVLNLAKSACFLCLTRCN